MTKVSLTFDDGMACQIEHALPLLRELKTVATFFVPILGMDHSYDPPKIFDSEFRTKVWKDAIAEGHEIGTHGIRHPSEDAMAAWTNTDLHQELAGARSILECRLGTKIVSHCYPKGFVNPAIHAVTAMFFEQARTVKPTRGVHNCDRWEIPSLCIGQWNYDRLPKLFDEIKNINVWLPLTFHGVGPDHTQVHNLTVEGLKSVIQETKARGIPIVTFAEGASEFA